MNRKARFGQEVELEAAPGFEPGNNGFADRRLSHLAMPPRKWLSIAWLAAETRREIMWVHSRGYHRNSVTPPQGAARDELIGNPMRRSSATSRGSDRRVTRDGSRLRPVAPDSCGFLREMRAYEGGSADGLENAANLVDCHDVRVIPYLLTRHLLAITLLGHASVPQDAPAPTRSWFLRPPHPDPRWRVFMMGLEE